MTETNSTMDIAGPVIVYEPTLSDVRKVTRFPSRFFVVTFLWSWVLCLPVVLSASHNLSIGKEFFQKAMLPMLILAAYGPAVGALYSIATLEGRGGLRRYLRSLLTLRFGWRVWILTPLVIGGVAAIARRLPELWGATHVPLSLPSITALPTLFLIMVFCAGGQEELGWRGYIIDFMEERIGPVRGNLILGLVWALWHLPLFLIRGTGMDLVPIGGFILLTAGYSWFFSWVRFASGKRILPGLYAHGLLNFFGTLFPAIVMPAGTLQIRYWVWAGFAFTVGAVAITLRTRSMRMTPLRELS